MTAPDAGTPAGARPSPELVAALHRARAAEKEQTLFYRALTAQAEDAGDAVAIERLNGLLADEQHHLSRLTARLLELGESVDDLADASAPATPLAGWEAVARERERAEVERYEAFDPRTMDDETAALVEEILTAERAHERELGGKWMMA